MTSVTRYAFVDSLGGVQGHGATSAPLGEVEPPSGCRVVEHGIEIQPGDVLYYSGGRVCVASPAPSEGFRLDTSNGEWIPDAGLAAAAARLKRDRLLADDDWVTLRAYDRGEPVPQEWREYFQALRDITEQAGFPFEIEWPQRPES